MTLQELMASLPNGFHDSELRELTFDFTNNEARLTLDVWVGDLGSKDPDVREKYQKAELWLSNLGFWISQSSEPGEFPVSKESLCIDISILREDFDPGVALPEFRPENPTYCLYSTDINTCFFFACQSASLHWL